MNLYTLYTPTHKILFEQWFFHTMPGDVVLTVKPLTQIGPAGRHKYGTLEFNLTMREKVSLVLEAIEENWGEIFVYSDVDTQFFQSFVTLLHEYMQGKDLLFQRDSRCGLLCAGFFCCRANEQTRDLWRAVHKQMGKALAKNDQDILNLWLKNSVVEKKPNPFNLKIGYLPAEFYTPGAQLGELWSPGQTLDVPQNIVMHHANWTIGINNKLDQLKYVRGQIKNSVNKESVPHVA